MPPARGGIPVPLSVIYDGGTRLGELGVGWSIPFSYVETPSTLAHTRPRYFADPNAAPEPLDRVYLVLGGNRMLMVRIATDTYRPMVGPQGMELIQESVSSWRLNDGSKRVYRFQHNVGLAETEGFWPLEEVNDATGLNPVKLFYEVQYIALGPDVTDVTKMAKELSLIGIEYNQQPVADAPSIGSRSNTMLRGLTHRRCLRRSAPRPQPRRDHDRCSCERRRLRRTSAAGPLRFRIPARR